MPESDAIALTNWIPDTGGVRSRKGYTEWAINFPGGVAVSSVMHYMDALTNFPGGAFLSDPTSMPGKLFAATDTAIYDITNRTNAPSVSRTLSGAQQAGWLSHVNFSNSGGSFLVVASEADGYYLYNGTAWSKPTEGSAAGQINGVDPGKFVQTVNFKRRLWFVERGSTRAWYLPTDAVTGTAAQFDFGPVFRRGGHLLLLANWTIDAGEGADDFLVAISSNGDVVVYKGTNPAVATEWALVGTFFVGQMPVGRRSVVRYGGDLVIISAQGIYPVSYITRGGAELLQASSKEYSSKIRGLIGPDLRASFTSRGWQAMVHPSERVMLVNVPNYAAVNDRQYTMSTVLNEWCLFQGIPIYSMGEAAGYMFAGTRDGKVILLFTGYEDAVPYAGGTGVGIYGQIIPAFTNLAKPTVTKMVSMVRPSFLAADPPNVKVGLNSNYNLNAPTGTPPYVAPQTSRWDSAQWDSAVWGGQQNVYSEWITAGATGFAVAAALVTAVTQDTTLTSIDYMFQVGGPL
jgi:hypothetical protein